MLDFVRKFFRDRKRIQINNLTKNYNTSLEMAAFYANGATKEEKAIIDEFLEGTPDRYKREVKEHAEYLMSMAHSDLEKKTK